MLRFLSVGRRTTVRLLVVGVVAVLACHDEPLSDPLIGPSLETTLPLIIPGISGPRIIAAGAGYSCALRTKGDAGCWGFTASRRTPTSGHYTEIVADFSSIRDCAVRDDGFIACHGAAGNPAGASRFPSTGSFVHVTTGSSETCGLRDDGAVECWGQDLDEIAIGGGAGFRVFAATDGATFAQISAGDAYACGVRSDGAIQCFGAGDTPDPLSGSLASPAKRTIAGGYKQVAGGGQGFTCAIVTDGSVIDCWGEGIFRDDDVGASDFPADPVNHTLTWIDVSAGYDFMCGVRSDGVVICNESPSVTPTVKTATINPLNGHFVQVSVAMSHACGTRDDGFVQCWGDNAHGEINPGTAVPPTPVLLTSRQHPRSIRLAWSDGAAEGVVYPVERRVRTTTWGPWASLPNVFDETATLDGPLPASTQEQYRVRICTFAVCSAPGLSKISAAGVTPSARLGAGNDYACAITTAGAVECWGDNSFGAAPGLRTPSSAVFTQLSAGAQHACAVRAGQAECWGDNTHGEAPATRTSTGVGFVALAAGGQHTCGLRGDAQVECWGDNGLGQAPATVTAVSGGFVDVSAGAASTCAVRDDGVVECWGANDDGEAPATRQAPEGLSFTAVSAGNTFTCGLRTDGAAECWGSGPAAIVKTPSSGAFISVGAGIDHACAARTDGVTECWGDNSSDQAPPTHTRTGGTFVQVSAGSKSCGMIGSGGVECWGFGVGVGNAAPHALTGVLGAGTSIHLSWTSGGGGATQPLQRRTWDGTEWNAWTVIGVLSPSASSSTDPAAPVGKNEYRVRACSVSIGCSPFSAVATVTTLTSFAAPAPVRGVGADTTSATTITVSWAAQSGIVQFVVRRQTWDDFTSHWSDLQTIAIPGGGVTSFEDTPPGRSTRNQYVLTACNAVGCSAPVTSNPSRLSNGGRTVTQISAGDYPCTLSSDGAVTCTAFGRVQGVYSQIADGICGLVTGTVLCWGGHVGISGLFTQLSAASYSICGFLGEGNAQCSGVLQVDGVDFGSPIEITTVGAPYTQVATGVAFKDTLGSSTVDVIPRFAGLTGGAAKELLSGPIKHAAAGTFTFLADGYRSGTDVNWCALRSDGKVECWTDFGGPSTFHGAGPGHSYTQLAGGADQACALRDDGSVNCWGDNSVGQAPELRTPQSGTRYAQVTVGNQFSCGLVTNGAVECWGAANVMPVVPATLMATARSETRVDLDWSQLDVTAATFKVFRRAGQSGPYSVVAILPRTQNSYADLTVSADVAYQYKLEGCNRAGCSGDVTALATTVLAPNAPDGVLVTASPVDVHVAWTDASSNETGFTVQRRTWTGSTFGAWVTVATPATDATSFLDSAVVSGTRYQYQVRACHGAHCSAWAPSAAVDVPIVD